MSTYNRLKGLAKESIVYAFPSVLQRSLGLITLPIYSRILTPEDYGTMAMMSALSCFVGMFISTDWDAAVTFCYHDATTEQDQRATVTTWVYFHFLVSLVLVSGLWLASERIAATFLGSANATPLIHLLAGTLLLGTGTWRTAWILLRIQKRKWWVLGMATSHVLLSVFLTFLLLAVWRKGVQGVYLGGLLASIPLFLVSVWVIRFWLPVRWLSVVHLRKLLAIGLPFLPVTITAWLTDSLNRFFLEHYHGLADVGLLSIATSLAAAVGMAVVAFQQAWWPFAMALKEQAVAKPAYIQALSFYLIVSCGAATALSVFTPELLSVLMPKTYHGAAALVGYTALTAVASGVCSIGALGITLSKKTAYLPCVSMVTAGVAILLNILLIPGLGIGGAALSSLIAQWTSAALLFAVSQRYYFIDYRWRQAGIILLATALIIGLGTRIETERIWMTVGLKLCWLSCFPLLMFATGIIPTRHLLRLNRSAQLSPVILAEKHM
jgi:O-antigen/teichoic acid export membrane protein